jgi:HD-like signal output (HDOD) protein
LLQLANSRFFNLSGKINSVSEALALLELAHVNDHGAGGGQRGIAQGGARHPVATVLGLQPERCQGLALLAGLVRQNQQAAFTCGLIHAIGELAMHLAMPEVMAALDKDCAATGPAPRQARARECWAIATPSVGAGFARMWHFPQAMVDALEHQYAPFENNVYEPLAGVIHLASWRARAKVGKLGRAGHGGDLSRRRRCCAGPRY